VRALTLAAVLCAAACVARSGPQDVWIEPVTGMAFVRVPAGRFTMGSPPGEPGREPQERAHAVTLTRAFYIGRFEVTQAEWQRVMDQNPSTFRGARRPVEQVNWHEAHAFLARLEALSPGSRFRLPTEAEWEYACRAGTSRAYHGGDALTPTAANVNPAPESIASHGTTPAGSFPANAWGIHDMHGNVWEWTADAHCPYPDGPASDPRGTCGGALKVVRGGSWYFAADSARCALRYTHPPAERGFSLGFRVVREPR
jgi:formylglycine-generating enzyme required for sulfatase activity